MTLIMKRYVPLNFPRLIYAELISVQFEFRAERKFVFLCRVLRDGISIFPRQIFRFYVGSRRAPPEKSTSCSRYPHCSTARAPIYENLHACEHEVGKSRSGGIS